MVMSVRTAAMLGYGLETDAPLSGRESERDKGTAHLLYARYLRPPCAVTLHTSTGGASEGRLLDKSEAAFLASFRHVFLKQRAA
jgi:hypothetical protein